MPRKGISPLVAAVLLVAFTLAVAGLAGPFLTEITQKAQGDTLNESQELVDSTNARIEVMSTSYNSSSGNYSVSIRNAGTDPVQDFTATIYGENPKQKQINKKLDAGEVHTFDIKKAGNSTNIEIESRNQPIKTDAKLGEKDSSDPGVAPNTVIEDFEWGEGESIDNRYKAVNGNIGLFSVVADNSIEGSYLLKYDGGNTNSMILPDQGSDYISVERDGAVFGCEIELINEAPPRPSIGFGLDDQGNGYGVRFDGDNSQEWQIWKIDSGALSDKLKGGITPSYDTRYFPAINWTKDGGSSKIEVTLHKYSSGSWSEVETLSATDSTYTSGTIGFHSTNERANWDHCVKNPEFLN